MAILGNNVKTAFLKGLEALGRGANSMAENAHQKLNEMNLETRRRELLGEIPVRAQDLWQQGAEFPPQLSELLSELSELDEQLTVLRAQRYAKVPEEAPAAEETAPAEEAPALQDDCAPEADGCCEAPCACEEPCTCEEQPAQEEQPVQQQETYCESEEGPAWE